LEWEEDGSLCKELAYCGVLQGQVRGRGGEEFPLADWEIMEVNPSEGPLDMGNNCFFEGRTYLEVLQPCICDFRLGHAVPTADFQAHFRPLSVVCSEAVDFIHLQATSLGPAGTQRQLLPTPKHSQQQCV